jgi:hypothetical protein
VSLIQIVSLRCFEVHHESRTRVFIEPSSAVTLDSGSLFGHWTSE